MINWNKLNPIPFLKESSMSLLSDGKLSLKRLCSLVFTIVLVCMIWYLEHTIIPQGNIQTFTHCFDILAGLIILLTGAATIKDIIALKNGTHIEETKTIDTPEATITSNKIIETPTNG